MPRIKGSYNAGMKTLVPWLNCARANSERYSPKLIFHFLTKIFIVHTDLFDLCLRVFWLFSSEYLQFSCFFLKEFWLFVFYGNLFGCLLRRRRRCSASDTSSTNSRVYVRQLCSEYQEIWLCGANRIWQNTFLQILKIYCWSKEFRSNIFLRTF